MPKRREPEHNLLENTPTPHQPSSHLARDFLTDLSAFQIRHHRWLILKTHPFAICLWVKLESHTHTIKESWTDSRQKVSSCVSLPIHRVLLHCITFWVLILSVLWFLSTRLFAHHLTTACFFHDALLYGFGSVCLLFFNKAFTCNCSSLYNLTEIGWVNN